MSAEQDSNKNQFKTNLGKISLLFGCIVAYEGNRLLQIKAHTLTEILGGFVSCVMFISLASVFAKSAIDSAKNKADITTKVGIRYTKLVIVILSLVLLWGGYLPSNVSTASPELRIYIVASSSWWMTLGIAMLSYTFYQWKSESPLF